ncbi:hypothetical protein EVAR_82549_1 [Eumeta japonica]|uniref:Uncharacterized protein n=1 Tax=Eumeta variegata TaxID=151549 RepID=A0A4C1UXS1_EUMVA|nr:hypothetical protein EVAR_82549_1 [Eumeta japonica]
MNPSDVLIAHRIEELIDNDWDPPANATFDGQRSGELPAPPAVPPAARPAPTPSRDFYTEMSAHQASIERSRATSPCRSGSVRRSRKSLRAIRGRNIFGGVSSERARRTDGT